MTRLPLLIAFGFLSIAAIGARAGGHQPSWIFRPSYYSHDPVRAVQVGRRHAGGPMFTRPEGDYFQVGVRYVNSAIQVGPYTWDNVRVYESWTQSGSQY
jgi:hypothetical protein